MRAQADIDWYLMFGREATGILWSAYQHIKPDNAEAAKLLSEKRDWLIDNGLNDEKSIFLLRRKRNTEHANSSC